jgi:hypothetical protein
MASEQETCVHVSQKFVAIGCNRLIGAADWFHSTSASTHSLLAYAAANFVALYDVLVYDQRSTVAVQ